MLVHLQIPVVRQLWLQGVVVTLDESSPSAVRAEGFFFVHDTIRLAPQRVHGQASSYTLAMSGRKDVVQDSPTFVVTLDRVSDTGC